MRYWLVLGGLMAAACGSSEGEVRERPLDSDGQHLRDDQGRVVLMRGVNARVDGVFDVTFDDGRTALEPIPELGPADCARMRQLGFNALRLPINWSGIEPDRGSYDEAYLQRVDDAVACATDADLFVVIDLHQDAYSKHIGEDGAPLWAIEPPPETLLEGPLDDLDDRRVSAQVRAAFESFFAPGDPHGLQADFIAMLEVVGARYADAPMVVGFEIFNEPDIGADELEPFHHAAAAALRQVAPGKLVFFEPPAIRNFLDFQPLADAPFPSDGAVYSPHIYTFVFGDQTSSLESMSKADLRLSVDNAAAEARAHGTPIFIGEFGIGPEMTRADDWIRWQAELHDEYLASNAFWLWKEMSQGAWGVYEPDGSGGWVERPQVVGWVSRLSVHRIAGDPVRVDLDLAAGSLVIEATGGGAAAHEVYVPEAAGFAADCDGTAIDADRDPATGVVALPCDGVLTVMLL
jgi:endoglycosylceramidase